MKCRPSSFSYFLSFLFVVVAEEESRNEKLEVPVNREGGEGGTGVC